MTGRQRPWSPSPHPGQMMDVIRESVPNQVAYEDPELKMVLRGALGHFVTRVELDRLPMLADSRIPGCDEVWEVVVEVRVPNRDKFGDWIRVSVGNKFRAMSEHRDRGMTQKQSCVLQALKFMWEHEFKEGLLFDGKPAHDPEVDHGPG